MRHLNRQPVSSPDWCTLCFTPADDLLPACYPVMWLEIIKKITDIRNT